MKQSPAFKSLLFFLCLISIVATYGQKQIKNYSERFTVTADAILDINTSHTDIEFETWNKDEVAIEATIELEGATKEEAQAYFESGGIDIMGNSKKVSISTDNADPWAFHSMGNLENLHIEIPELPEFESFEMDFDMAELDDLPPVPPTPDPNFDYEAFQKDGEKYLKEWQKKFQKDFGEPYQKNMEEWQQKMEAKQEEMEAKRKKMLEKRRKAHADRMESRADVLSEHAEKRAEELQKRMEERQVRLLHDSTDRVFMLRNDKQNRPNVFYFNSGDENRNYKVKKSIKIKMPKSTKIRMNVRHGEVKLAGNTQNLNAILNHASLFATTIDGDNTKILASYSPVSVQYWNYGDLQVDYSENVKLQEVLNLHLSATSSDVVIDKLSKIAFIKNNFGPLSINSISDGFETLDVSLQNAELACNLPKADYTVYANGTDSQFILPDNLNLEQTSNHRSMVYKGYRGNPNSGRTININSRFSEITLE